MQSHKVTGLALIVGALAMIVAIAVHPHHGPDESGGDMASAKPCRHRHCPGQLWHARRGILASLALDGAAAVERCCLRRPGTCRSLRLIGWDHRPSRGSPPHRAGERSGQIGPGDCQRCRRQRFDPQCGPGADLVRSLGDRRVCLSISMLQSSSGWKIVGACGIALGLFILLALALGRLQMSLHNIGLVVLGSGIWLIAIGSGLCGKQILCRAATAIIRLLTRSRPIRPEKLAKAKSVTKSK